MKSFAHCCCNPSRQEVLTWSRTDEGYIWHSRCRWNRKKEKRSVKSLLLPNNRARRRDLGDYRYSCSCVSPRRITGTKIDVMNDVRRRAFDGRGLPFFGSVTRDSLANVTPMESRKIMTRRSVIHKVSPRVLCAKPTRPNKHFGCVGKPFPYLFFEKKRETSFE